MKDIFLVDMDETLLDFKRAERVNLTASLGEFGIQADENLVSRFHRINDSLWKALERGEIAREKLKVRRFELLFSELRLKASPEAVARAYWENFPFVCFPFEGALGFLKQLSEKGRIYVVTNGGAAIQTRHIADAGFSPYLSGVFISETVGFDKPSLNYADYVEAHIPGYLRAGAVWIGDSLTSDRNCAQGRGIDFILFSPEGAPEGYHGAWAKDYDGILRILDTM